MRRKQRNIAATLLAGMLLLLTMFTVSAQSNTITPTLKKVGYGIKDSSGTVNVYEQAFLIKSGAVNVHGGIAICFDTGKGGSNVAAAIVNALLYMACPRD